MGATPATSTDGFVGTIKTLTLNVKANIVRVECTFEDAPDFRMLAGNVGSVPAGRTRPAKPNATTFSQARRSERPAPIYATLTEIQGQEGPQLIWSRNTRR